jgi:hypothetical protein
LVAIATDNSGTQGTSQVVNVEFLLAPPSGEYEFPLHQQRFLQGTNLTLTVDASDLDGDVALVEFFQNDVKIGETNAPLTGTSSFLLLTSSLSSGSYTFTARVIDNDNLTNSVAGVQIEVLSAS